MEDKNISLLNEAQSLQDCVNSVMSLCYRLTPNNADVNAATIRSLNNQAEALRGELFNLQSLIDNYSK